MEEYPCVTRGTVPETREVFPAHLEPSVETVHAPCVGMKGRTLGKNEVYQMAIDNCQTNSARAIYMEVMECERF